MVADLYLSSLTLTKLPLITSEISTKRWKFKTSYSKNETNMDKNKFISNVGLATHAQMKTQVQMKTHYIFLDRT